MPDKIFTRGQTQILYRYLPGAIFEHEDYGLCRVEEIATTDPSHVNRRALFDTLVETLGQWESTKFREGFPDPRNKFQQKIYKIGQPTEVRFSPFPRVLQCLKCKHVIKYEAVNRKNLMPGRCPRLGCGGRLTQLRYVELHNCGRMQEIHVPQQGCPDHGMEYLRFFNPGRTQKARWVCGICNREIQKLRMTPCNCAYTEALEEIGRPKYERFLKIYPTGEPGIFIPHIVAFINFNEQEEQRLYEIEDGYALMLARLWGLLPERVIDVAMKRKRISEGVDRDPTISRIVEALRLLNPEDPNLKQYDADQANPYGQEAINNVKTRLSSESLLSSPPSRRLVEHIALLDTNELTDVDTIVERLNKQGSFEQAKEFQKACQDVMNRLGFGSIKVINDFPIALAAIGYTRISRDPNVSVLNPFPPDKDGKIPLFVIPTQTEGMWFQLDPVRVAQWLVSNNLTIGPAPETSVDAWAWLYERILSSGFQSNCEVTAPARSLITLLHTISHVLLQRIEWSGFSSSSVGEYLIPETLSFILYANRYAETKIGGLTTLFEQRLPFWLQDAAQTGRDCIYDPLCSEDGGSCAGCLHREHNCPLFNHKLSRAVLFGGVLPPQEVIGQGRIEQGYWTII